MLPDQIEEAFSDAVLSDAVLSDAVLSDAVLGFMLINSVSPEVFDEGLRT